MKDYRKDFADFQGKIWLNAASEGPLPLCAHQALKEAVAWKSLPYQLDEQRFSSTPKALKESISQLMGVSPHDIILGNSASYGLHILANGIPWQRKDEIILMQNDFPTNILPWLALAKKGVSVRQIFPKNKKVLTPEELLQNITPRTKLFCVSHVHTFTGYTLDVEEFSKICIRKNITFVLNISQSAGTMPVDFSQLKADAVVCAGYKWLCGPYGTGFCWIKPNLRETLDLNMAYWIAMLSAQELSSAETLKFKEFKTARKFDVFGTANFFNFVPFQASIDYWLNVGIERVRAYHDELIDYFLGRLQELPQYELISPADKKNRSSLLVISHNNTEKNLKISQTLKTKGIYTAWWKGNVRISPHVYNTISELEKLLENLKEF